MMFNHRDLANILDICLARIEAGEPVDVVVSQYAASAEKAAELRAILEAAQAARPDSSGLRVPASAQRDSRQRFLARAQQYRQQPGAASLRNWRRFLAFLRGNLGSLAFSAAAIALLFVALASVRALPGETFYPVKLVAEQASISLASSGAAREELVTDYDLRRAAEVADLIRMGRTGTVSFGGYLDNPRDQGWVVAGIPLQLPVAQANAAPQLDGVYVEITGQLDKYGSVQVESLQPRLETVQGTIRSMDANGWEVGSQVIKVNANTRLSGTPRVGSQVSIQAAHLEHSNQVLAVTASITGAEATDTETPTAALTATTQATQTPEPSATVQPTKSAPNAKPILTQAPEDNHDSSSKDTSAPQEKTSEPEDSAKDH